MKALFDFSNKSGDVGVRKESISDFGVRWSCIYRLQYHSLPDTMRQVTSSSRPDMVSSICHPKPVVLPED